MKYVVQWTNRDGGSGAQNEDDAKRLLQLFSKWSPAPDATFHQFVERLTGDGGYAVVETDNPLAWKGRPSSAPTSSSPSSPSSTSWRASRSARTASSSGTPSARGVQLALARAG